MQNRIRLAQPAFGWRQHRLLIVVALVMALFLAMSNTSSVMAACADGETDNDGDGICTPLDCNDNNGAVFPGAPEICDGLDNNCDGSVDEISGLTGASFGKEGPTSTGYDCFDGADNDGDGLVDSADPQCQAATCGYGFPDPTCVYPPGVPSNDYQCAPTQSVTVCEDGAVTCANPTTYFNISLVQPAPEDFYTDACHDGLDNDFDGLTDQADPDCNDASVDPPVPVVELCNGLDDDYDGVIDNGFEVGGVPVGGSCSNGQLGVCAVSGVVQCSADGLSAFCTAPTITPGSEGPFGNFTCSDGLDNDCDGVADFPADSSCTAAEVCDGLDNDGDGTVDNGDFTFNGAGLGASCTVGIGACQNTGSVICSASSPTGAACSVKPLPAGIEGPNGPTCSDGIDNDCDGLVDAADPSCGTAQLAVQCALPGYGPPKTNDRGKPGADCNSWHTIDYAVLNASANAQVTAELLAYDVDGNILGSVPVSKGQVTHMASRVSPEDYKLTSQNFQNTIRHDIFAPIPVLRVSVQDGANQATAYCATIPYLQVVQPSGQVTSDGGLLSVEVALPLIDVSNLEVLVDGVDILAGLSNPALPGGPYSGVVEINGQMVNIIDLTVSAGPVGQLAANTLTMKLSNLGCGGHVIAVNGQPVPGGRPNPVSSACHVDDGSDTGLASVFAIEIASPASGEIIPGEITQVTGEVCHGRSIVSIVVNGQKITESEITSESLTPGDGITSADTYKVGFSTARGRTDLLQDINFGDQPLGTFDEGSNRLIVEANDDLGNRAFASTLFATGDVAAPGIEALIQPFEQSLRQELQTLATEKIMMAMDSEVSVDNAFVLGLTPQAINDVFQAKCVQAAQQFKTGVESKLQIGQVIHEQEISGGCSCDPTVRTRITGFSVDPNAIQCPVTFENDKIHVDIQLPPVVINLEAKGSCRTEADLGLFEVCIAETKVNAQAQVTVSDVKVAFDITEQQLLGNEAPGEPIRGLCEGGANAGSACGLNSDCASNICRVGQVDTQVTGGGAEVNCLASACNWVFNAFAFLINTVTFTKLVDPVIVDFTINDVQFTKTIDAKEVDPFELEKIKVDEEEIANYDQKVRGELSSVEITPDGLVAGLTGTFATLLVDPSIPTTPGGLLTAAPVPSINQILSAGGKDASVLLADDTINMMLASMTQAGRLQSSCVASGKTVGDLLPADCNNLGLPADTAPGAVDGAEALCHGIRGTSCETLVGSSLLSTPVKQGICHGLQGTACSQLPAGIDGIVWPSSCESISIDLPNNPGLSDVATAIAQGICHAKAGDSCEALTGPTDQLTAYEQGACYGEQNVASCQTVPTVAGTAGIEKGTCEALKGTTCGSLPTGQPLACTTSKTVTAALDALLRSAEQQTCANTPSLDISAASDLLFCSQQEVPPAFKVVDDPVTAGVETALRLNDLSMAIVIDRDSSGDLPAGGELGSTPNCLGGGAAAGDDCFLAAACLDINMVSSMDFATCSDGKPGFVTNVQSVQANLTRPFGVLCNSTLPAGDDTTLIDGAAAQNQSIELIKQNAEDFAPPICANGLTLGGFVNFLNPSLIAVNTDGDTDFQDYFGLTGEVDAAAKVAAVLNTLRDGLQYFLPQVIH